MFKKERWWTGTLSRLVQLNIVIGYVYATLILRKSQTDLVTLPDFSKASPRKQTILKVPAVFQSRWKLSLL